LPNHKSAAKRMKISAGQRDRNRSFRSRLRQAIKDVRSATNHDTATQILRETTSIIDKAAGSGLIHKRTAARNKSRLTQFVSKLG
jgi:small subunit ribosomal protein S20